MFNGQKIKDIISERGMTQKEVFTKADIKQPTFYTLFNDNANPTSNILESIADVLECNIDDFFDRNIKSIGTSIGHQVKGSGNKVSGDITLSEFRTEIEHLKILLEERERVITEKERIIQILIQKQK